MKILLITGSSENRHQLMETFTENMRNVECFEAQTGMESLQITKSILPISFF